MPAGILSPYRDGERGVAIDGFANRQRGRKVRPRRSCPFLPVPIRGEMSGRTMRGGAGFTE
ncbi:hypothetical protein FJ938_22550 [Mesorhizobium sp. B2-4-14]|nr:hypothetical protein FJ548_13535 [Mesorhizobium sp. B2-4-17]TPL00550.1 hypothetical protein FJ938_22550 [Mesorhizobium sp. B2-4-14]